MKELGLREGLIVEKNFIILLDIFRFIYNWMLCLLFFITYV